MTINNSDVQIVLITLSTKGHKSQSQSCLYFAWSKSQIERQKKEVDDGLNSWTMEIKWTKKERDK